MTLDKHAIQGIPSISAKTLSASDFERLMVNSGYIKLGAAPAKGNRIKVWWNHPNFPRVESIYSPDMQVVITAYHV
jgi:hypothetical protein